MLPTVTEVVEISHRLGADVFQHLVETGLAGIEEVAGPILLWIGRAPSHSGGTDLVEVAVGPAHCGLDRQMQAVESDVEGHLDAAQNRGLNVVEGDLHAGDGIGAHAATLRRSISAAQFHGESSSRLWLVMRASTSMSQACGSTLLGHTVWIRPLITQGKLALFRHPIGVPRATDERAGR